MVAAVHFQYSAELMDAEVERRRKTLESARERAALAGWREAAERKRSELVAAKKAAGLPATASAPLRCVCGARPASDMTATMPKPKKGKAGFFARRNAAALAATEQALEEAEAMLAQAKADGAFQVRPPADDGCWQAPDPSPPPQPSPPWVKLVTNAEKALASAERRQQLRLPIGVDDEVCTAMELLAAAVQNAPAERG